MKKTINIILVILALAGLSSCVDDYMDANPPRAKDGPFFNLTASGDVLETPANGNFIGAGQTLTLTLNVIDCQGGIDSVGFTMSDTTIGTPVVDQTSLDAVQGAIQGQVVVNYTTPGELDSEVDLDIDVTLYDGQPTIDWYGREVEYRKSSTETYTVTLVVCTSTGLAGTYSSMANGFFGDGAGGTDGSYSDLATTITITEIRPGLYEIDDMSFGLYPELYGDTAPTGQVNLCGTDISDRGDTDQYGDPFTITGTLNQDGSVDLTWINTWGDRGTVVLTPQ
jgi:hypothetical protein